MRKRGRFFFLHFLEIYRESHLQVEVERVLVALRVERHSGDVVRQLGLDVDAHMLGEIVLRPCRGMHRPLQSLDGDIFFAE